MTFGDWVKKSRRRFETETPKAATIESTKALLRGLVRRYRDGRETTIWERGDWDVLVVLDACRYDLWKDVAPGYGLDSHSVMSNATCSYDWIDRNFLSDAVDLARVGYVTGNPFADHDTDNLQSAGLADRGLGHFAPLYKIHWKAIGGTGVETIPPKPITNHAIATWRRRDELGIDRMVVHYMQPHQPYRSRPDWERIGKNLKDLVTGQSVEGGSAWQMARRNEISMGDLWEAYRDNLTWVLDDVTERLVTNLDAKVVVTSDHGNAMGELGDWGHPAGALAPQVRRVPWVSVAGTDTNTINPGVDVDRVHGESESVDAQLEALGYC